MIIKRLFLATLFVITLSSCHLINGNKISKKEDTGRNPANANDFCNWGFAGPKQFQCRGKKYLYGSVACSSGIYSSVFCESKYHNSGRDCSADNSPDTIACYKQMQQSQTSPQKPAKFCNWGFAGPKRFQCRGKNYVYGHIVACSSEIYNNVFCEAQYSNNINNCLADTSPNTIACYQQMR